jgi:hypothetical protein
MDDRRAIRRWFQVSLTTLLLVVTAFYSEVFASPPLTDVESLAALLRPRVPMGWKHSLDGDRVILERAEPVEFYNSVGLPRFRSEVERRAYIKPQVRREKLIVALWLGDRVSAEDFKRAELKNAAAINQVRKERGALKDIPTASFWKEHPEYGYRQLPFLNADTQSIYMESQPEFLIHRPKVGPRPVGLVGVFRFWDPDVEK